MKYGIEAATREEWPDMENWDWVVEILQICFWYGRLPTECTCQTTVLVPKGNGYFRGVGIVKVLWKALLGAINWRIG